MIIDNAHITGMKVNLATNEITMTVAMYFSKEHMQQAEQISEDYIGKDKSAVEIIISPRQFPLFEHHRDRISVEFKQFDTGIGHAEPPPPVDEEPEPIDEQTTEFLQDELVEKVIEFGIDENRRTGKDVTASMIQRKFHIGYPRALRLIEAIKNGGEIDRVAKEETIGDE